jgi:hypothetical protein
VGCHVASCSFSIQFDIFLWHGLVYGMFQAVSAMVQQAMQYIDDTPDLDTRIELIETLNNVSAGKVGVLHSR